MDVFMHCWFQTTGHQEKYSFPLYSCVKLYQGIIFLLFVIRMIKAQGLCQRDNHKLFLITSINQESLNKEESKGIKIHYSNKVQGPACLIFRCSKSLKNKLTIFLAKISEAEICAMLGNKSSFTCEELENLGFLCSN